MASRAKPQKTVGVYERPAPPKWPKIVAIALAVLVLVVASVALWGTALAGETPLAGMVFVRTAVDPQLLHLARHLSEREAERDQQEALQPEVGCQHDAEQKQRVLRPARVEHDARDDVRDA